MFAVCSIVECIGGWTSHFLNFQSAPHRLHTTRWQAAAPTLGNCSMLFRIAALLSSIILTPAMTVAQTGAQGPQSDYPFQCGAAYAILAETFRLADKLQESERYRMKFTTLAGNAEEAFLKVGRKKEDAQAYMQQHVDALATLAVRGDASLVISFGERCDSLFSDP